MDACMNEEQQVPEYQQWEKSAMEHAKEKARSTRQYKSYVRYNYTMAAHKYEPLMQYSMV